MKEQEIIIAIAEFCFPQFKWQVDLMPAAPRWMTGDTRVGYYDDESLWHDAPNYLYDLNAMRNAEESLTPDQQPAYWFTLKRVCLRNRSSRDFVEFSYIHAASSQRAEAFVKNISKWKD